MGCREARDGEQGVGRQIHPQADPPTPTRLACLWDAHNLWYGPLTLYQQGLDRPLPPFHPYLAGVPGGRKQEAGDGEQGVGWQPLTRIRLGSSKKSSSSCSVRTATATKASTTM